MSVTNQNHDASDAATNSVHAAEIRDVSLAAAVSRLLRGDETVIHCAIGSNSSGERNVVRMMGVWVLLMILIAGLKVFFNIGTPSVVIVPIFGGLFGYMAWTAANANRPIAICMSNLRLFTVAGSRGQAFDSAVLEQEFELNDDLEMDVVWKKGGWQVEVLSAENSFYCTLSTDDACKTVTEMISRLPRSVAERQRLINAPVVSDLNIPNLSRLLFLPVGILSALVLARDGFAWKANAYFNEVLNAYESIMQAVAAVFFEPVIKYVLASLGDLLHLRFVLLPHWKYAFILWWLAFAAIARAWSHRVSVKAALPWYAWGAVCALLSGVITGLYAASGLNALLAMSGMFFYVAGIGLALTYRHGGSVAEYAKAILFAAFLSVGLAAGLSAFLPPGSGVVGLKIVASTVLLGALVCLAGIVQEVRREVAITGRPFWLRFLSDPVTTSSLEVLTVLGGAAASLVAARLAS